MLKITQPNNQLCSLTCFLVFACSHQNIYLTHSRSGKKTQLNKLSELEYFKKTLTDRQLCSLICFFCNCLLKYVSKYLFNYCIWNQKNKTYLYELTELECSKTPSQISSSAHKHVFLYLHAQTNINTLLYWSYTKS